MQLFPSFSFSTRWCTSSSCQWGTGHFHLCKTTWMSEPAIPYDKTSRWNRRSSCLHLGSCYGCWWTSTPSSGTNFKHQPPVLVPGTRSWSWCRPNHFHWFLTTIHFTYGVPSQTTNWSIGLVKDKRSGLSDCPTFWSISSWLLYIRRHAFDEWFFIPDIPSLSFSLAHFPCFFVPMLRQRLNFPAHVEYFGRGDRPPLSAFYALFSFWSTFPIFNTSSPDTYIKIIWKSADAMHYLQCGTSMNSTPMPSTLNP